MDASLNTIVAVSILGLIAVSAVQARKTGSWRQFWLTLAALAIFSGILYGLFGFPFPEEIVAKGTNDLALAAALFICMTAGMFAQYLYRHFERPKRHRRTWDWGLFFAPIFASPIVLIPLLAAFQGADIDLSKLTAPRIMMFCVAFQNGFFWKEFFDRKQKEEEAGKA